MLKGDFKYKLYKDLLAFICEENLQTIHKFIALKFIIKPYKIYTYIVHTLYMLRICCWCLSNWNIMIRLRLVCNWHFCADYCVRLVGAQRSLCKNIRHVADWTVPFTAARILCTCSFLYQYYVIKRRTSSARNPPCECTTALQLLLRL